MKCSINLLHIFLLVILTIQMSEENMEDSETSTVTAAADTVPNRRRGGTAKLIGINNKRRESKIAEVFMGVAYGGAPNQGVKEEEEELKERHLQEKGSNSTTEDVTHGAQEGLHNHKSGEDGNVKDENNSTDDRGIKDRRINETKKSSAISSDSYIGEHEENIDKEPPELDVDFNLSFNKDGMEAYGLWMRISNQLGSVWYIHVYIFAFLFSAVSLLSLSCLISLWCLPGDCFYWRGLLLYCLILTVALTRSALLVTDPYGVYHYFQESVSAALHAVIIPGTATLVAMSLSVIVSETCLRIKLLPNWVLLGVSLILTVTTVALDVTGPLRKVPQIVAILKTVTLASVAFWGSVLCLGFVSLLIKVEKIFRDENVGQLSPPPVDCQSQSIHLRRASRFGAAAGFIQLLLSGLIVYSLVGPRGPPGTSPLLTWAWCLHHSLSRLLEVALCFCLTISTAFVSVQKQKGNRSPFLNPLPPLFRACCNPGTTGIHPVKSSSRQPLNVFTIPKTSDSVDYVTSDFQLVWTQGRNQSGQSAQMNNSLANDRGRLSSFKNGSSNLHENGFSRTLPHRTFSDSKTYLPEQVYDTIKEDYYDTARCGASSNDDFVVPNYKYLKSFKMGENTANNFSATTRSASSNLSATTALYWSPASSAGRNSAPFNPYSRASNSLEQISEAGSQSEVHIDYLTVISSSVDGISLGSEVTPMFGGGVGICGGGGGRWQASHTLPFRIINSANESKLSNKDILSRSETNTPLLEDINPSSS